MFLIQAHKNYLDFSSRKSLGKYIKINKGLKNISLGFGSYPRFSQTPHASESWYHPKKIMYLVINHQWT